MRAPRYQDLRAADIPKVELDGVRAAVIAGEAFGVRGPAQTHAPIVYVHLHLDPGATVDVPVPAGANAFVYAFAGSGTVGSDRRGLIDGQAALLGDGDTVAVRATTGEPFDVLVLAGEPLREPVARYGPFVMNTKQEIIEAFDDYQSGRMGAIT
jgi:redox-sensitive bicupin YhaK (pirin superfamily)